MMHEFNFFSELVDDIDLNTLFGPMEPHDGPFIKIESGWRLPNIMVVSEVFQSLSQAKKNGWDKDIPTGWSHIKVKGGKKNIFIWNPKTSRSQGTTIDSN